MGAIVLMGVIKATLIFDGQESIVITTDVLIG